MAFELFLPQSDAVFEEVSPGYTQGLVGNFLVQGQGLSEEDPFIAAMLNTAHRLTKPNAVLLKGPILSPQEWLDDPYYSGDLKREYWPQKREDFVACAQGDNTGVTITGSIGYGKTALTKGIFMYDLYRVSRFENPQQALGIGGSESLGFVMISQHLLKAKVKMYTPLRNMITRTPYFRREFMFDGKVESAMEFPNGVVVKPGVTGEGAIHSEDLLELALSEANFLAVVQNSRRKRGSEKLDVAEDIIDATITRMRSRFQASSSALPLCRIILDSSRQYPDDYVERHIAAVQAGRVEHKVFICSRSLWEAKRDVLDASGKKIYSGETFPIEVGDQHRYSRILTHEEVPHAKGKIIWAAVELRAVFERDIERALRDFAGIAVLTLKPLISNRQFIFDCVRDEESGFQKHQCQHPFTATTTSLRDSAKLLEDVLFDPQTGKLRVDPERPRTAHIDIGLTGDALGLCIGHVTGLTTISRGLEGKDLDLPCTGCRGEKELSCDRCNGTGKTKQWGHICRCSVCQGKARLPCKHCRGTGKWGTPIDRPRVYIDLMLRVVPPGEGSQIQFDDIESLLKRLRDKGMRIPVVTADGTESAQFLQRQTAHYGAMTAEKLSVDVTKEPYYALRNAIYDVDSAGQRRISFYEYLPFFEELVNVEDRPQKIDHPHNRSKDISDAVAGVVFNCERFPGLHTSFKGVNLSVQIFRPAAATPEM